MDFPKIAHQVIEKLGGKKTSMRWRIAQLD